MKKTQKKIIDTAKKLFNEQGVSKVSLRQIAADIGMSHSNLMYHFNSKDLIIEALHDELLTKAMELNKEIKSHENYIQALFESTQKGFEILYQYKFLMLELNYILRENESLRLKFIAIEQV